MSTRVADKQLRRMAPIAPQLDSRARLAALRGIFGMWKHRKPNPVREQNKIRKEWDRSLSR